MATETKKSDNARFLRENELTAALNFVFQLSNTMSINTTVSGAGNNIAVVSIVNGTVTLWSGTLLQFAPTQTLPYSISGGGVTIEKGATFTMTIPSTTQQGSVMAILTMTTPTMPPTQFNFQVATWSLPS